MRRLRSHRCLVGEETYTKELDVIKDMVVVGEVVAGDDIDASIFLKLPMSQTQSLALSEKILLRKISSPVCFRGFLEVTVDTHAGETEDGSKFYQSNSVKDRGGRASYDWTMVYVRPDKN